MSYGQAFLYVAAATTRILLALAVMTLLLMPFGLAWNAITHGSGAVGVLLVAGLALLGVGLPLLALLLARYDWQAALLLLYQRVVAPAELRLTEPRTLVRPLAYTVLMLTLGGAVSVLLALLVIGSGVALISPYLALTADEAVIGPFTVRTLPQSLLAAVIGASVLTFLIRLSPLLARVHAASAVQWLTRPEQQLEQELNTTVDSRARLLRAFSTERRRIERDLHDGVQPELLAVSMRLGLALDAMPADAPGREDVQRAQQQARQTLEVLRRFVRGIHPQVLVDHGLGAAVQELTDNFGIPMVVIDSLPGRLPAEVESNLYFCIAELLTNVVKHSGASHATIELSQSEAQRVRITVQDDGKGGTFLGSQGGLRGISDRVAALDGELRIDSPVGGPTTVQIEVPVGRKPL